jgi:glutamyl-tRNA synthetase
MISFYQLLGDGFNKIVIAIIRDFESGVLPTGPEENFLDLWKNYVKTLGKELGLKGKDLFHPLRLALTSRMSGPDIGDQLLLLSYAPKVLTPETSAIFVPIKNRIEALKTHISLNA